MAGRTRCLPRRRWRDDAQAAAAQLGSAVAEVRVGLNFLALGEHSSGIDRYTRELAPAMLAERGDLELHLFVPSDGPAWMVDLAQHPRVALTRFRAASTDARTSYPAQVFGVPAVAKRSGCDLLHGPANFAPPFGQVPRIVTVHDVMWIEHAELSGFTPLSAGVWRALTTAATRTSRRVIAVSHTTSLDLQRLLKVPQDRIDVVPLGAGIDAGVGATPADEVRTRYGLGDARVLLSVGQKRPHKNVETVLRALAALPEDVVLVAPGADAGHGEALADLAQELGVSSRVRLLSWVEDADLEGLYNVAAIGVQMSLLEGFGLPALEAMQRGVPTIVSTAPALVEAVGDAAIVVEPRDDAGLARAIQRVLVEPGLRANLVERGHRRCGELTWSRTARRTLESYDRALFGAE